MEIERYEHVMHIVSVVTGKVKKDISPIDVVTSLLPTAQYPAHRNYEPLNVFMK